MFEFLGALLGFIFDGAAAIASFVADTVWPVVLALVSWGKSLWGFVRPIWDDVIKPTIAWVDRLYGRLQCFLLDHAWPVLQWVKKATQLTQAIYHDVVKPIMTAFATVRAVLEVLKALHVPWAAQLEADLNKLESKVLGPVIEVINGVNQIGQVIDGLILDPVGLFVRSTLLKSLFRDQVNIVRLVWGYALRHPAYATPARTDHKFPLRSFGTYVDVFVQNLDAQDPDGVDLVTPAEAAFDEWTTVGVG